VQKAAEIGAADLIRRLRENTNLFALAVNPLLLTMVAHVHNFRGALPGTRAELYREICQVFLGKRQEAKGLMLDTTADQREYVLRVLAFEMTCHKKRDIPKDQAVEIIQPALASVDPSIDPAEFIVAMESECGLLLERENALYCFAHLTFQEYLAAAYISDTNQVDVLTRNVSDDWWRETILLYVAQWGGDEVVSACLADDSRTVATLALAADCTDEARHLAPDLRRAVEELIGADAASSDIERKLLAAKVMISRRARKVFRVGDDTWICTRPVSSAEYELFQATVRFGARGSRVSLPTLGGPDGELRGIQADRAQLLTQWAKEFHGSLSLPTEDQLERAVNEGAIDLRGVSAWTSGSDGKLLLTSIEQSAVPDFRLTLAKQLKSDLSTSLTSSSSQIASQEEGSKIDVISITEISTLAVALLEAAVLRRGDDDERFVERVLRSDWSRQLSRQNRVNAVSLPRVVDLARQGREAFSRDIESDFGLSSDLGRLTDYLSSVVTALFDARVGPDRQVAKQVSDYLADGSHFAPLKYVRIGCAAIGLYSAAILGRRISSATRRPISESERSPWDAPDESLGELARVYCELFTDLVIVGLRLNGKLLPTETLFLARR
jgi:hypothetical protein